MGEEKKFPMKRMIWGALALVLIFWIANLALPFVPGYGWPERGQFGSMFGMAGSLFSGLAFWGIIYALLVQQRDNSRTRDVIIRQNFENTFFHMVRLHHEILSSLSYDFNNTTTEGRECIKLLYHELQNKYKISQKNDFEELLISLGRFHKKWVFLYGHYYRNLYQILRFISEDKTVTEEGKKQFYANIVRAQLSTHELALLFYNCLVKHEFKKFIELIVEFRFFDNFDLGLIKNNIHFEKYKFKNSFEAFGDQAKEVLKRYSEEKAVLSGLSNVKTKLS